MLTSSVRSRNGREAASARGGCALAVLLELVSKLPEAHPQELGGASLDSARPRERHLEVSILDLVQSRLQVEAIGGNVLRDARLLQIGRQRVRLERVPASENQRALDDVLQLADVPGPAIVLEDRERLRADALHRLAELGGDFPDEVRRQERDVLPAVAKRRQIDRNDVEPIEEIL